MFYSFNEIFLFYQEQHKEYKNAKNEHFILPASI